MFPDGMNSSQIVVTLEEALPERLPEKQNKGSEPPL
jgi:hypothetical protein